LETLYLLNDFHAGRRRYALWNVEWRSVIKEGNVAYYWVNLL